MNIASLDSFNWPLFQRLATKEESQQTVKMIMNHDNKAYSKNQYLKIHKYIINSSNGVPPIT
jgi:hypothetical protein